MRDFTIKSFLIQQMYNNNIDIALINETMLNKSDKLYIKGYKVYRADAKTRKGVAILISNRICCDSYKTMSDDEGRFIQVKLKDSRNEITIATAYVEPEKEHIIDILPENIINSEIFAGDLNRMKTGLETTAKVYHIKNMGIQKTKIEVIKKISDHPIIIYEKNIPFEKSPDKKIINTLDNNKIKINNDELKKALLSKEEYIPKIIDTHTTKQIPTSNLTYDNQDYNEYFDKIKNQNKEKFQTIKRNKKEEIAKLIQCNTLGHEPYQRLASLMQFGFNKAYWTGETQEKNKQIIEGFKELYGHNPHKQVDINKTCEKINDLLDIIIQDKSTENIPPPHTPHSRAKDINGFSQRDLINLIKGNNLNDTAINFKKLLSRAYASKNSKLLIHRTSKFFFKKKNDVIETYKDLRALAILPAVIMVLDKIMNPIVRKKCENYIASSQHGGRENRSVNTEKLEVITGAKQLGYQKALLIDITKAFDTINRNELRNQIKKFTSEDNTLNKILNNIVDIYDSID